MNRLVIPVLAVLAASLSPVLAPALAQETGGLALAPGMARGPSGLARPMAELRFGITAQNIQSSIKAPDFLSRHQALIAQVRGDAGYLGGFSFGTPLSASVQRPVPVAPDPGFDPGYGTDGSWRAGGDIIVNNVNVVRNRVRVDNFQAPVSVISGNGNVVEQQSAQGSGPIALQQVTDTPGKRTAGGASTPSAGGAVNAVTGNGNIMQLVPGRHHGRRGRTG